MPGWGSLWCDSVHFVHGTPGLQPFRVTHTPVSNPHKLTKLDLGTVVTSVWVCALCGVSRDLFTSLQEVTQPRLLALFALWQRLCYAWLLRTTAPARKPCRSLDHARLTHHLHHLVFSAFGCKTEECYSFCCFVLLLILPVTGRVGHPMLYMNSFYFYVGILILLPAAVMKYPDKVHVRKKGFMAHGSRL